MLVCLDALGDAWSVAGTHICIGRHASVHSIECWSVFGRHCNHADANTVKQDEIARKKEQANIAHHQQHLNNQTNESVE